MAILSIVHADGKKNFSKQQRPNIVLINVDDLGWHDVGFMGSEYYETPNIDRLAAQGIVFTNGYAGAANSAPSRACLMTGKWTPRHGIYTVENSDRGKSSDRKLIPIPNTQTLSDTILVIPELLKKLGYSTCHAGKWHLSSNPLKRGFDVNIGGSHAGNPGSYYPPYRSVPSLKAPSKDYCLTNLIMDKTIDFISTVNDKPFFLYYAPYAVHTPIQAVKSLLPKYKNKQPSNGQRNAAYATMIENVDIQIGRLVEALEKNGKLDNTLIIFTSDNGGVSHITSQNPLRAGKGAYYEGGVREPMFFVWKGRIKPATRSDFPVTQLDFLPTILEAAGSKIPIGLLLDGESLMPLLSQNMKMNDRPLFWHFPIYLEGGDAECQDTVFRTRPGSSVRMGDWKLIQYFENNDIELYNVRADVSEKHNMVSENPAKVAELLALLQTWRMSVNAPVPDELNPRYQQ